MRLTSQRMPPALLPLPPPVAIACGRVGVTVVVGLVLAVLTAACGQEATPGGSGAGPGPTASEVRVVRVGGVAGLDDELVVGSDGHVTGTTRTGAVDCRVDDATVRTLAGAPVPGATPAVGADRIATTLERDGTTYDLGEAQGADPLSTTVRELLDDVQQPEGRRTVCR